MQIKSAKDLKVYKKAYSLAMEIYKLSKTWPPEEKYSLTDQIRRASRSVCSNLREAGSAPFNFYPVNPVRFFVYLGLRRRRACQVKFFVEKEQSGFNKGGANLTGL